MQSFVKPTAAVANKTTCQLHSRKWSHLFVHVFFVNQAAQPPTDKIMPGASLVLVTIALRRTRRALPITLLTHVCYRISVVKNSLCQEYPSSFKLSIECGQTHVWMEAHKARVTMCNATTLKRERYSAQALKVR